MANRPAAALGKALRAVLEEDRPALTDRDLLHRFAREGDQAAFAALVGRHTPMVLGVCRRGLGNAQDAEDACQATFLVLARKAREGGRWQPSVANYLYATARRVARNARVVAQRRARREARAAVPEAVPPADRMTGRELLAALDEELSKLPPLYREPLILCYLEGLTRDEAAARLGVATATIRRRIESARERLLAALTRGGCALGASLLALAITSPARASSPQLVESILATVSGPVPDAVADLAKGVAVKGVIKNAVLVLAAGVAVVALGVGLASVKSSAAGEPPDKPAPPTDSPKTTSVSGRVLDSDGQPLGGAKLLLLSRDEEAKELGETAADGTFKVAVPADRRGLTLAAGADGHGLDFHHLGGVIPAAIELRLVKDRPVRGRVLDTQGKPVVGSRVIVTKVDVYPNDSLDSFLSWWKSAEQKPAVPLAAPRAAKDFGSESGMLPVVKTDAEGRFTVTGLGVERLVTLRVRSDGLAESELLVVNREGFDPGPYNEAATKRAAMLVVTPAWTRLIHGPNPTVVTEAEKRIRGVVTDVETGKPRQNVTVSLTGDGRDRLAVTLTATTDAEGRYEIRGARKAKAYVVEAASDPVGGSMTARVKILDTPGYEPVPADVRVKKGVVVAGRIIDAATKKPVPGFVRVGILTNNKYLREYPQFDVDFGSVVARADEDGNFRVVTIPGRVLLMGGPAGGAERYRRAEADPKHPDYPRYSDDKHRVYFPSGDGTALIQLSFCKVLESEPGTGVVRQDVPLDPVP